MSPKNSPKRSSNRKSSNRQDRRRDSSKPPRSYELLGVIKETALPSHNTSGIVIRFEGELWKQMGYIWTYKNKTASCPEFFKLAEIKPKDVEMLGRPEKRGMLRELANLQKYPKRKIEIASAPASTLPKDFPHTGDLSVAAIFVLNIALKGGSAPADHPNVGEDDHEHRMSITNLFAELVGCATAATIVELSPYLRPPLIELGNVPKFIHCAVRQIARGKEHRSHEPVELVICTIGAIGAALDHFQQHKMKNNQVSKDMKAGENMFTYLLRNTLAKASIAAEFEGDKPPEGLTLQYSRDLGCHAGLLAAGFQRYIFRTKADDQKRKALCDLFIDVSTGMLTAIPLGGFVFGPVGSLAKYATGRWVFEKYEEARRQLSQQVQLTFDMTLAAPIFFDGEVTEMVNGAPQIYEASWDEFSKWYTQIISWNYTKIEQLGDEDKKKEKKGGKTEEKEEDNEKKKQDGRGKEEQRENQGEKGDNKNKKDEDKKKKKETNTKAAEGRWPKRKQRELRLAT